MPGVIGDGRGLAYSKRDGNLRKKKKNGSWQRTEEGENQHILGRNVAEEAGRKESPARGGGEEYLERASSGGPAKSGATSHEEIKRLLPRGREEAGR